MTMSIRIPDEKAKKIEEYAKKKGLTKTAVILEALDEKLGLATDRRQLVRQLAGWMGPKEADELKKHVAVFNRIGPGDWD